LTGIRHSLWSLIILVVGHYNNNNNNNQRQTTVYWMSRIGVRSSGLWLIRWNQTSAFLRDNQSSIICPIIGQPMFSL